MPCWMPKKIQVETSGNKVTLRGKVRNFAERDEAERIAQDFRKLNL
jgi:osmotically-inducible protein OsmY